jgi:adenylyltransferase/sulfurtransferase
MSVVSESTYYARHLKLPGFTTSTQDKLRKSRVLVIGVGGLGCPAALYLAGAGVGTIGLCDPDVVSATNLHRQVLFDSDCIGEWKVGAAARRLESVNPHIKIETIRASADAITLQGILGEFDVVLDGTDNFSAKYAISDACELAGVPLVYGSIYQFEGQVSVFNHPTDRHPTGISYRDVFPDAPPDGLAGNCGEAGVIGVLPGIIGTMQASEVIKLITGLGTSLAGKLFLFDALSGTSQTLTVERRRKTRNAMAGPNAAEMEISLDEFTRLMNSDSPPSLVDVRDPPEHEASSLGGVNIPLFTLHQNLCAIPKNNVVIVYCKSGARSAKAALYLQSVLDGASVRSLQGGIDGWHCSMS